MPRRLRLRLAGMPFHVIQRGNNRSDCFHRDADHVRYLRDLQSQALEHGVAIHAYVLMTNHVHLLMTPRDSDGVGSLMKALGQRYAQYLNRAYQRTGSVWDGRYRSCLVDTESYFLTCHRYIECNPVRAGMAADPAAYRWSSFRANALGQPDEIVTAHSCVLALGRTPAEREAAYRELFDRELPTGMVDEIRKATNGGFALGSQAFRDKVAKVLGCPVQRRKRGPKPKV
jgi:putative transposase